MPNHTEFDKNWFENEVTNVFGGNVFSDLDFEVSKLKNELNQGIIIPESYVNNISSSLFL